MAAERAQEVARRRDAPGMELRIAARQEDRVADGRLVGERREERDFGSGPPPAGQHMVVGKREGLVARDRDALARRRQGHCDRCRRFRRPQRAEGNGRRRHKVRRVLQPLVERGMLARRHQPQMARGQRHRRLARQCGQDRHRARPLSQQRLVAVARDAVQDGARNADVAAVAREPFQQRGDRLALPRAIHRQHDRPAGERCEVGGGAAAALRPVEEAHDALDHGDVGVRIERGRQRPGPHRPGIEIAAGPARGGGEEARVDIVRPRLVGLHGAALPAKRADKARGNCRLAAARGRSGDDDALHSRRFSADAMSAAVASWPKWVT